MTDLSDDALRSLLHAAAASFMVADPGLSPAAAMARSCALAVLVYDQLTVEAALRTAARKASVPDALAQIVAAGGGASAALTPSDLKPS